MSWEGLNRRKFPRAKFPCLIKVSHENSPTETILTHTENISVGGVCVIIKKHMEMFAPVLIEVDLMDGSDIIAGRGRVVWTVRRKATEQLKPAFYDTGIEFVNLDRQAASRINNTVDYLVRTGREAVYK